MGILERNESERQMRRGTDARVAEAVVLNEGHRAARSDDVAPVQALRRLGGAYLEFIWQRSRLFKMLFVPGTPSIVVNVSPSALAEQEQAGSNIPCCVAELLRKGIDARRFRSEITSHESFILHRMALIRALNHEQRSPALKGVNTLGAGPIVGSDDFNSIHSKRQAYLFKLLFSGGTSNGSGLFFPSEGQER